MINYQPGASRPITIREIAYKVAGHIEEPMTLNEIAAAIDSDYYNAELLLQHLLLWAARQEQQ